MDGWMDNWIKGMDGWMDNRMKRWLDIWMDVWMLLRIIHMDLWYAWRDLFTVCVNWVWCCFAPCLVLLGFALLQPAEVPQWAGPEERSGTRQTGPHQWSGDACQSGGSHCSADSGQQPGARSVSHTHTHAFMFSPKVQVSKTVRKWQSEQSFKRDGLH